MDSRLALHRTVYTDKSTIGELSLNHEFICHTLEDTCRAGVDQILQRDEKVKGQTAIPAGQYEVILNYSNRFKQYLPLLLDVPLFEGVRIHPGNRPEHTEGCILVGRFDAHFVDCISESRATFGVLFPKLEDAVKHGKLFIEVVGGVRAEEVRRIA